MFSATTPPATTTTTPVQDSLPQPIQNPVDLPKIHLRQQIETYSWSNGKKIVTVYIPIVIPTTAGEDATKLSWTPTSIELEIRDPPSTNVKVFTIDKTYEEIEGAELKRKEDKLVLILKKKNTDRTWYKLSHAII
jgi:hypothetical protein